ncbi:MAG: hypothetical protein QOA08_06620 [Nitrososphaeraceae archaeon]|nr:hypothetical protein [Nitrososphaeraceae archaeon]
MINLDFNTRYTTVLKERVTGRMVAIVDFNGDEGEIRITNTVLSMVLRIS